MHISQRKNFEAKAENEQRALTNAFTFINGLEFKDGEYQTFWDTQYTSSNNRMYYNSNLFNVQTQQIHRALAGLEGFKTTFDPNQSSMTEDGTITEYGKFLRGVAENMEGIENNKLFQEQLPTYTYRTVDKVASKDFLPAFEAYLNQDIGFLELSVFLLKFNNTLLFWCKLLFASSTKIRFSYPFIKR